MYTYNYNVQCGRYVKDKLPIVCVMANCVLLQLCLFKGGSVRLMIHSNLSLFSGCAMMTEA